MSTLNHKTRRLRVLLIAPEVSRRQDLVIAGEARPSVSDPAHIDYAELLSAYNYAFDIVIPEDIAPDLFVDSGSIRYSSIVLAVPTRRLSDTSFSVIRQISFELGVSLIAAYDHPDGRSGAWFGIQRFTGKRMLWPLRANIIRWPSEDGPACVADYGPQSGLPGIRRRGLRKLSWKQTFTKGLSLMRGFKLPYMRAARAPQAQVLSTTTRGEALAWSYQFGNATNYYFALHGDLFLDKYNEMHRLVRSALDANSGHGMVCADLDKTMVLRLDDPGASKADYVNGGCLLTKREWNELGNLLEEEHTPLSVMYTPAWVDDGDHTSGSIFIDDKLLAERVPGILYDSARVKYVFADFRRSPHDHASEFHGLETLVKKRLVDVHSHGLTHLVPDYAAWASATDKHTDMTWYTEFYHSKEGRPVSIEAQATAMERSKDKIEDYFNTNVAVLTPSSHKHDSESDVLAHAAGYTLFSSDYTGVIKRDLLVRNWKIPALMLYFKEPSASISAAGYPVVGVIHDYEIKQGLELFRSIINKWTTAGIRRYISLNSLAASLCSHIDARYSSQDSRIEMSITLPATAKSDRRLKFAAGADIRVKVALPEGSSYKEEPIEITGGLLESVEQSTGGGLCLLVRVIDSQSITINVPLTGEKNLAMLSRREHALHAGL